MSAWDGMLQVEYTPGDPEGPWRLWYGGFIGGKNFNTGQGTDRVNAWHFANSTDGIMWNKPNLGVFDLSQCSACLPAARAAGRRNNVLMSGDGMGVYRDNFESNASRRFKAFGTGCFGPGGVQGCVSGTGTSHDGIHWGEPVAVKWPAPQRYDCHQNLIRDPNTENRQFVLTTRDFTSTGRDIAIVRGPSDGSFGSFADAPPTLVEQGTTDHQLYSQVTFPFYNVWLGLVAIFDTKNPSTVGTVHTRLSWSLDSKKWAWLDPDGLTGRPFIPLGAHDKQVKGSMTPPFDSHIIFAAHTPIAVDGEVRVYYAGGNGPHNGARNTSIGLATLRPDGFGGIAGSGTLITTADLLVTGPTLTVTADINNYGGSVRVALQSEPGLGLANSVPILQNCTDAPVKFSEGKTLKSLIGKRVSIIAEINHGMLYTFGFAGNGE